MLLHASVYAMKCIFSGIVHITKAERDPVPPLWLFICTHADWAVLQSGPPNEPTAEFLGIVQGCS